MLFYYFITCYWLLFYLFIYLKHLSFFSKLIILLFLLLPFPFVSLCCYTLTLLLIICIIFMIFIIQESASCITFLLNSFLYHSCFYSYSHSILILILITFLLPIFFLLLTYPFLPSIFPIPGTCSDDCIYHAQQLLLTIFVLRFLINLEAIFMPYFRCMCTYCCACCYGKTLKEDKSANRDETPLLQTGKPPLLFSTFIPRLLFLKSIAFFFSIFLLVS